tara:strand:- start:57 stop:323 length:267 start_codon:yes stop_codon:yes gene_type:complete
MSPSINDGDLVIFSKAKTRDFNYKPGDIVVARNPKQKDLLIIKRVFSVDLYGLFLIGDNTKESKDSRHFGYVNFENIYGIVENIIRLN